MSHQFALQMHVASTALKFGVGTVPRPPFGSGYRVAPTSFEFWREGQFRHHEHVLCRRIGEEGQKQWLFP